MTIQDSVAKVLSSIRPFGEDFYEVLFRRCPEMREHFEGVDMKRQALILTMALSVIEQHYSTSYPATGEYMRYLGTKHHSRGIARELYAGWRDSMLESLERFHGAEWSEGLATEWTRAIDLCHRVMFEGYDKRFNA